jgi:L-lactate dehydrogenase complex protein LldE
MASDSGPGQARRVGLFVTCLVNTMRPSVGFAAVELLERAGCDVEVPRLQSCCGQPAYNSGDDEGTRGIARRLIEVFEEFDYVVVPSGSCGGMIKTHFPEVFEDQPEWSKRARELASKTHELLSFLTDVCRWTPRGIRLEATYTYHDSCSGLREMGVYEQPRELLSAVEGLSYRPMARSTECCGFGGTFCVKYPDISNAIVGEKIEDVLSTDADLLLGGDMGCLMNMAGKLNRDAHSSIEVLHTAEVLAGKAKDLVGRKDS